MPQEIAIQKNGVADNDKLRPFKTKNTTNQNERQQQKSKALEAISRYLSISEKYTKLWQNKLNKLNTKEDANVTVPNFNGQLRDYQQVGVKWLETLYLSGINGILADEMGLGKTVQVIAFLCKLLAQGIDDMHIIVVPLSTMSQWTSEFKRFAPVFPVITYHGYKNEKIELQQQIIHMSRTKKGEIKPIVIVPPHTLKRDLKFFCGFNYGFIIIDEGHKIKNHNAGVSQAVRQLRCSNKLLLTGTPLQNNLYELWSLLNFLMPSIFHNMETFDSLLQTDDLANENLANSNSEENSTILDTIQRVLQPFMLRRLKANVLNEILPKKEVLVYCNMSRTQLELYQEGLQQHLNGSALKEEEMRYLERSERRNKRPRMEEPKRVAVSANPIMYFRKVACHPLLLNTQEMLYVLPNDERLVTECGKMQVLDQMLERLIPAGHKVLIFSTFAIMLDLLEDLMDMRGYQYERLDGTRSLDVRTSSISRFNSNTEVQVFLITTRAGGLGLNLTAADTVIFYDRDWNPHADLQAQARCHRIGQNKPVMVYTLISTNTIDEYILTCSDVKLRLEKAIIHEESQKVKKHEQTKNERYQELLELIAEKHNKVAVNSNALKLTKEVLDNLLDRSELEAQMQSRKSPSNACEE